MVTGAAGLAVFIAALVMVGSTAIPSGWGLYGVAAGAVMVYIPIGIAVWRGGVIGGGGE